MKTAFHVSVCCTCMMFSVGCGGGGPTQTAAQTDPVEQPASAGSDSTYVQTSEAPPVVVDDLHEPTASEPVSAGVAVVPSQVRPGESVTLVVTAKVAPAWHIYAIDQPTGVSIATSLNLKLPESVVADGKWQIPAPHLYTAGGAAPGGPTFVYDGEVSFYRQLKVSPESQGGQLEITCEFGYQACTESTCLPPKTLPIPASIDVLQ